MTQYQQAEVYDWATDEPQQQAYPLMPYTQQAAPMIPPNVRVMAPPGQTPYYAYMPAPPQPQDPRPQLMYGMGVMMAGGGVLAIGVGVGSWFFFRGMALAVDSIIGVAIVAGAFVFLKAAGGIRIGDVTMGDGANFQVGKQR
jgi:hypothetical protein